MKYLRVVTCILLGISLSCGCSKKSEKKSTDAKAAGAESESLTQSSAGSSDGTSSKGVVGVWYGTGGVNEQMLTEKMRSMGTLQAIQLQEVARDHLATEIAINFAANGLLEMDIEIKRVTKDEEPADALG